MERGGGGGKTETHRDRETDRQPALRDRDRENAGAWGFWSAIHFIHDLRSKQTTCFLRLKTEEVRNVSKERGHTID